MGDCRVSCPLTSQPMTSAAFGITHGESEGANEAGGVDYLSVIVAHSGDNPASEHSRPLHPHTTTSHCHFY